VVNSATIALTDDNIMTQLIDLGKLRFNFAGSYQSSTSYQTNDVVKYGGNIYAYTNAVRTSGNLPTNTSYWTLMVPGMQYAGAFTPGMSGIQTNQIYTYNSGIWVSILDNPSAIAPSTSGTGATYWSLLSNGVNYVTGNWTVGVSYSPNTVILFGGSLYICTTQTTGLSTQSPNNTSYWSLFMSGVSASQIYSNSTVYNPGNLVIYGPSVYQCITTTTAGIVPTNTSYWQSFNLGLTSSGAWAASSAYLPNQIVTYGGATYTCLLANTSTTSFNNDFNSGYWTRFTAGMRWMGTWISGTSYLHFDVVVYNGSSYLCTGVNDDPSSSTIPPSNANWSVLAAAGAPGGLPMSGGTLTGPLTLSGDPSTALMPSTKQYADRRSLFNSYLLMGV
jgi:hypothetical protein